MSARGKHHRPAPLTRRLLLGLGVGVIALVLVLSGGTGATFYQSSRATTASLTSASLGLAIGSPGSTSGSGETITVSAATTTAYSSPVALFNTGTDRNPLAFVDSAVAVGSDAGGLRSKTSVTWVVTTRSDCSTADYSDNVVLSSGALSLPSNARAVGASAAPTINRSGSVNLCARYQLTDTSAAAGSSVTATFTFIGWDVSFTSNTVSWAQTLTIGSVSSGLHVPPTATDCGKQFSNGQNILNSYQFGWFYPYQPDGWAPSGYRVTFAGSPSTLPASLNPTKTYPVAFTTGGTGQYSIDVTGLDALGTADIIGTFTVVGLDASGNVATQPTTYTFTAWQGGGSQSCTRSGS